MDSKTISFDKPVNEPLHVLIVEDDEDHRELILRAFRSSLAHRLSIAEDLAGARQILARDPPALVLADLRLPDGRGIDLLRDSPDEAPFPLLVLTSHGNEQVAVEAMKAGALDYVVKSPESLNEILRIADRVLREWHLILERRRAREERRRLENRLEQSQKLESLGVLAAGIAHDFNNLVMALMGKVQLALAALPPGSQAHTELEGVEITARRATELCRQLLAYSGRGSDLVEPVALNPLVEELAQLLETVIPDTADLRLEMASDSPWIEAVGTRIRQIVMNLILNAADALEGTPGLIRVRTTIDSGRGLAVLEVMDTGCGMDEETRQRIFDPFYSTKTEGRGLGLAALRGIVQSHRGTLELETEPGRGTTFRVFFPALPASDTSPACQPTRLPGTHRGSLLVVDDDETIRAVTSLTLEGAGFRVHTAENGRRGLEFLESHMGEVGIVLLDLDMPELDGAQTFSSLQTLAPNLPVIASSGHTEQEVRARLGPVAGYIQKPYTADQLIPLVRRVLAEVR